MPLAVPQAVHRFLHAVWEVNGTDLLLTAGAPPLVRVDGQLQRLPGEAVLQAPDIERLVTELLGEQLTKRLEDERQVDFSFTWAERARLRGNAFHQRATVALALRIIPFAIPSFAELGLPPVVERWCWLPHGLVLVTGPTGSGKSTTLASMIDYINTHRATHIVTIEDPIEYLYQHRRSAVNQREVGEDTASFADALRAVLREDPDVLLLGEMRDPESIRAALTVAETGHLVFTTLHTNDTAQALDRIVDVFPGDQQPQVRLQLANTLAGIINQQLIPRIAGGRVAAFEILVGSSAVRNLIREGKSRQIRNMVATGQREGMQTFETGLSNLITRGLVTYEEAQRWSLYPREIKMPPRPGAVPSGKVKS